MFNIIIRMANKNDQIYTSRKTILELMKKQGYNTTDYQHFSINEVDSMKNNNQLDMLLENTNKGTKIYIRYYLDKTMRQPQLHEMIDDLYLLSETLKKQDTLYIIVNDPANESLIAELKHIWEKDKLFIVVESIKWLQFNILNHILVPEHTIMTDIESKEIIEKYKITNEEQLPNISRFDPISRAICLRPGQMCHIIRPSKTAIASNYYRICI